ncbi:transmembrane 7 superfamily member 3-like [Arctopsyche grandis]|uniref:transmembrane 7 superfamily member 3-like n=1 Tax=Arctopsyche grandis TaxID=121162 RepID=UPI00406D9C8D
MGLSVKTSVKIVYFFILFTLKSMTCTKWDDGEIVNISLNNSIPTLYNSEVFSLTTTLSALSTVTVSIADISLLLGFLIVQVHSFKKDFILSFSRNLSIANYVNGTNLGLMLEATNPKALYIINNSPNETLDLYFSIHAYYKNAPVPGGCNMEFNVVDAPFMRIEQNNFFITVDIGPARIFVDGDCDASSMNVTHNFYKMYLNEWDHSVDGYFEGLKKMITVESILEHGTHVPHISTYSPMRRLFSLYPGIGSFYAVIAKNNKMSSAYVPIHTYSYENNYVTWTDISVMIAATIIGLIMNFIGYKLFSFQFATVGLLFAIMLIYTLINFITESLISIAIFYITGFILLYACLKFSTCIYSPLPAMFALGFQLACIIYYSIPDGVLQHSEMFWTVFTGIILITTLLPFFHHGYNIAYPIIGSFCLSIMLDSIIGSYLRYIIINTLRRISVDDFNVAIIDPPYQWRDLTITIFWLLMTLVGIFLHVKNSSKRYVYSDSLQTPLLVTTRNSPPVVYGAIHD